MSFDILADKGGQIAIRHNIDNDCLLLGLAELATIGCKLVYYFNTILKRNIASDDFALLVSLEYVWEGR